MLVVSNFEHAHNLYDGNLAVKNNLRRSWIWAREQRQISLVRNDLSRNNLNGHGYPLLT